MHEKSEKKEKKRLPADDQTTTGVIIHSYSPTIPHTVPQEQ